MSRDPRTGNPGGRGVRKTAHDIAVRLEGLAELLADHEHPQLIAERLGVSVQTIPPVPRTPPGGPMLTLMDWFCGAGGSSQGAHAVPGVIVTRAANHWQRAIESHASNFPDADHYQGDIRTAPVERWPVADLFWASPECPQWSNARGKKRDFASTMQGELFGPERDEEADRSRALMEEVPLYLRGVQDRGGLVLAGVVENVIDVRAWDQWDRWLGELHKLGYRIRVIAINSMHAQPGRTRRAPQSRDRLYVAYWHESLGRDPDWDRWLRPAAWCPSCDEPVSAMQVFKTLGRDMGRYRQQYVYRCPRSTCRNAVLEPGALPAAAAIDWTLPGQRIGDRDKPLADKTLARIKAGLERYARPLTVPAGGTWRSDAAPVTEPMPARTTRENDGLAIPPLLVPFYSGNAARPVSEPIGTLATQTHYGVVVPPFITVHCGGEGDIRTGDIREPLPTATASGNHLGVVIPPLLVPVEGRDGKEPSPAYEPLRTQTARNETGLAWLPFITELRGGSSDARPVTDPLATVTASGNHHGLVAPPITAMVMRNNGSRGDGGEHCTSVNEPLRTLTTAGHQSLVTWETLLAPYYGTGVARPVTEPIGALSTRDRYAVIHGLADLNLNDVLFRMLEPHEIGAAMAFGRDYIVLGNKRERVRQYGNAVTPPVAEVIVSALVECITGEALERAA